MSEVPTPQSDSKQVKRACTECRQQKAKCDAYLHPNKPCSRCRKMNRHCTISEPFKREHKRKRMSELEQQTDELQQQLRSSTSSQPDVQALPERPWKSINSVTHTAEAESRMASVAPFFRDAAIAPASFRSLSHAVESLQTPESLAQEPQSALTLPRSLEGQTISSKDIDELFQLYFRDYATFMPILDPSMSPNAYYTLSPFLFWAIVGVACRSYTRNPTLLGFLPAKIHNMALLTLNSTVTLQIVQGLLLVLCWPFPKVSTGHDLGYPLTGALVHMATQMGLHLPVSSQEFSRVRLKLDEDEIKRRAETWGYCQLIYMRSCLSRGNPISAIFDIPHDPDQKRILYEKMPATLKFELKLQDVITRCCIAASQNGLRVMTMDQERSLDTLLSLFHSQIATISLDHPSIHDQFYVRVAILCVQSFVLFKSPASQDPQSLYDLCVAGCQVVESFEILEKSGTMNLAASGMYSYSNIMLPCHILLRLLKTSYSTFIDVERAKAALFLGISLHKRMSLQNDDLPARNGAALTNLWNSSRAFKKPNGSEAVALRVRSRLLGSILLDGILWWREEHGAVMGVYAPPLSDRNDETQRNDDTNGLPLGDPAANGIIKQDFSSFLDDPMLIEFGWSVGDDIFSPAWAEGTISAM